MSREVTAQDFVDSWTFNTDPELGDNYTTFVMAAVEGTDDSGFRKGAELTGVKAIDDYTLEVTLKYPYYEFPITMGHPVAFVEPVEYIKQVGTKAFREKPVGTGPYMVQKWIHNQSVELVKNPSWWQAGGENGPFLDTVHMPIYLNTNTEWLDFQKGTIDWTTSRRDRSTRRRTTPRSRTAPGRPRSGPTWASTTRTSTSIALYWAARTSCLCARRSPTPPTRTPSST